MADKYKEIGAILGAARRDRNKTLKDAEENTKIMASYLEAIEAGEPEKLPAREYFMLFSRSYAQYLGVDSAIFDEIEETAAAESALAPTRKSRTKADEEPAFDEISPHAQEKKFGKTLIYIVIAIVVVFIGFLVYTQLFMKSDAALSQDTAVEAESADLSAGETSESDQPEFTYPDQPWEPPAKLVLRMVAKQNVWAVVARDGDTVMNRELLAGQQRQWEADYRYSLTVGISSAVDLFLNDQKLRPLSDRARTIKDLEINQVNYEQFLASDSDQTPITITPVSQNAAAPSQAEEESWIERSPEPAESTTAEQQPDTSVTTPPEEEESWIERRPDTTETDTISTEAPGGN